MTTWAAYKTQSDVPAALTPALGTDGTTVTDAATTVLGAIGANSANNVFNSATVVSNADGSVLERLEMLQGNIGPSYSSGRYLSTYANFALPAWGTATAHEVFVVTGLVRVRMWIEVISNVDSEAHGATLVFGNEVAGQAAQFIAETNETALLLGTLWYSATPALFTAAYTAAVMDYVVNGTDIGYTVAGEALTQGTMRFHCVWEPLNSSGLVEIGGGGDFA